MIGRTVSPNWKSWNDFLDLLAEWNAALAETKADTSLKQSARPRFSDDPLSSRQVEIDL